MHGPGRLRALLLAALLVASGAAALAHEAAWQRLFTPFAGAGARTTAAVVAGTMLGLGAGAAVGGRLAERVAQAGLAFGLAEALGALVGAAVPSVAALLAQALGGAPDGVRVLVVGVVCAAASAPLGASLPFAVHAVAPEPSRAGPVLARLYAANTLGAILGVAWPTAVGFEAVGTRAVVFAAASLQAAVALVAVAALRRTTRAAAAPATGPDPSRPLPRRVAAAAFLAGAAGLAVEVAWMRRLTPALGTTSYAFGTVLASYLAAVVVGVALLGPRRDRPPGPRPALVLALAALPVVALVPLVGPVARWAGAALADALAQGDAGPRTLLWIRAAASGALLLPAAAVGAASLPWLVHAAASACARTGRSAGAVLAWNTVGSAAAAAVAGLVAVPALGTAGTLRAAAAAYALAGACVASGRLRAGLGVVAAGLAVAAVVPLPDDAGRDAVGATFDPAWTDPAAAPATFFAEGAVSTVVVRDRDGRDELWVDGKVVASGSPTDRLHLALLGHLPMLAHPAPTRVAVVGLGTGITSGAVAAHAPARLDVFELEREVVRAAEAFRPIGGGLPASARLTVVDGRHGLLRSDVRYDVITSDPIHPAAAGSAELYTDEHYEVLASRLAPGGVVCQWLPLYELSTDDVRMVLRTMARRFEVAVFVAGPDLVLIGTVGAPPVFDEATLAARLASPACAALRPLGLTRPGRLLGLLLADPARVRRLGGSGPVNTDDRPVLEFASARSQYVGSSVDNVLVLGMAAVDPAGLLSAPPAQATWAEDVERARRSRRAFVRWMSGSAEGWDAAAPAFARLADEDPDDRLSAWMRDECTALSAQDAARGGDLETALRLGREVLARPDAEVRARLHAAEAVRDAGALDEAAAAGRRLLEEAPRSERARRLAGAAR
ncbi:MAG: hypothetical protein IT460_00645 [Planctomycetes bacterium]|nr:hypothetical protein [Planctomycetota bacterium]